MTADLLDADVLIALENADLAAVRGHRRVTDAYLISLTRFREGVLATLDGPLAALHTDALLVPA